MTDNIPTRKTLSLGEIKKPMDKSSLLEKSIKNSKKQFPLFNSQEKSFDTNSKIELINNYEKNKKIDSDVFGTVKLNVPVSENLSRLEEEQEKNKKPALSPENSSVVSKISPKQEFTKNESDNNKNKKKKSKTTTIVGEAANIKKQIITKYVVENVEEITEDEYNVAEYEKLYGRTLIIKSSVSNPNSQYKKRKKEFTGLKSKQQKYDSLKLNIKIDSSMLVREFAEIINIKVKDLIKKLLKMGIMLTANQEIDRDTAELIAMEYGHEVSNIKKDKYEETLATRYENVNSFARPPIVTIMGHVDHGKTSLLDAIRDSDVAAHEKGGITQHIGAYSVTSPKGNKITFIDTPGHEAFSDMRSRGARITDIVVLVVAADDGIMPQTIEAINHAKKANNTIIVAINKIDKPGANVSKVRESLMQYDLLPEEYGGTVITVPVSATTKENLDKLLESITLQAEVMELEALNTELADGTILESKVDKQRGISTTVLVQNGILKQGDIFVSGIIQGKIRTMLNCEGKQIKEAYPSTPVEIFGFENPGLIGDPIYVVESEKYARNLINFKKEQIAENYKKENPSKPAESITADQAFANFAIENKIKNLYFIIKTDTQGSLEAVKKVIERIQHEEFKIKILYGNVGPISDSDIEFIKSDPQSINIVAFNIKIDNKIARLSQLYKINILEHSGIYHLETAVKALASELLTPIRKEENIGTALVKQLFDMTKFGKIAGCTVTNGVIKNGSLARIIRGEKIVYKGEISSLRHMKDEVKEVLSGRDCGIKFSNYEDIVIGDRIEAFVIKEEKKVLD